MVETIPIEDLKSKLRTIFCAENKTQKKILTHGYLTLILVDYIKVRNLCLM